MSALPFQFHAYGFLIGLGIVVSVWIVEWIVKRERIDIQLNPLIFLTVFGGVVGARVYHLITDWRLYQQSSVFELIAIWNGGLGFIGALVGGVMGLVVGLYIQKKMSEALKLVDAIALALPFAQGIGRWGNFFNQELYGVSTRLPWGLTIQKEYLLPGLDPTAKYHPLFLYESIHLLLFGIIMTVVYRSGKTSGIGSGIFTGSYILMYSGIRFLLEFLRIETAHFSWNILSFLSIAQWLMIMLFFVGIFFLMRSFKYATQ